MTPHGEHPGTSARNRRRPTAVMRKKPTVVRGKEVTYDESHCLGRGGIPARRIEARLIQTSRIERRFA
jgi:hypothetical protein